MRRSLFGSSTLKKEPAFHRFLAYKKLRKNPPPVSILVCSQFIILVTASLLCPSDEAAPSSFHFLAANKASSSLSLGSTAVPCCCWACAAPGSIRITPPATKHKMTIQWMRIFIVSRRMSSEVDNLPRQPAQFNDGMQPYFRVEPSAPDPGCSKRGKRSPDERSDIRGCSFRLDPHVAALIRATCY